MPEVLTEAPKSDRLVKRFQERRLDAEIHRIIFGKECCWDSAMVPEIAALCSKEQVDLSADFIQLDEHGKHVTGIALPGGPVRVAVPRYSSSVEAAMLVIDHYWKQGVTIQLEVNPHGTWRCWLRDPVGDGFTETGYEMSMPLAICLAVLSEFGIS